MNLKSRFSRLINQERDIQNVFVRGFPPGHFYSPIPSLECALSSGIQPGKFVPRTLPGIDTNDTVQLQHLDNISKVYREFPYLEESQSGECLYTCNNNFFSYGDAVILYGMIRTFTPKRIIEIGSGYSSALMLDINNRFFDGEIELTFIEPFPDRLHQLRINRNSSNNVIVLEEPVQTVDLSIFTRLEKGDVLFVDSSHVGKVGSDLLTILFDIIPALASGVVIHFHDIFWPFEYPKKWYEEGRAWNEAYFLRTMLTLNKNFCIEYHNHYISLFYRKLLEKRLPLCIKNPGGSIYLSKVPSDIL